MPVSALLFFGAIPSHCFDSLRAEARAELKAEREAIKNEQMVIRETEALMDDFAKTFPDMEIDPESGVIRPKVAAADQGAGADKIAAVEKVATADKVAAAL